MDTFEHISMICAYESFMAMSLDKDDIAVEGFGDRVGSLLQAMKRAVLAVLKKIRDGMMSVIHTIQRKFRSATLRVGLSKESYDEYQYKLSLMQKIVKHIENLPSVGEMCVGGSSSAAAYDNDKRAEINDKLTYIHAEVLKLYDDMKSYSYSGDSNERINIDPKTLVNAAQDLVDRVKNAEKRFSESIFSADYSSRKFSQLSDQLSEGSSSPNTAQNVMQVAQLFVTQCQKIIATASAASAHLMSTISHLVKLVDETTD